jgi:hypothetical protein
VCEARIWRWRGEVYLRGKAARFQAILHSLQKQLSAIDAIGYNHSDRQPSTSSSTSQSQPNSSQLTTNNNNNVCRPNNANRPRPLPIATLSLPNTTTQPFQLLRLYPADSNRASGKPRAATFTRCIEPSASSPTSPLELDEQHTDETQELGWCHGCAACGICG